MCVCASVSACVCVCACVCGCVHLANPIDPPTPFSFLIQRCWVEQDAFYPLTRQAFLCFTRDLRSGDRIIIFSRLNLTSVGLYNLEIQS